MIKIILILFFLFFSSNLYSNENLLTIQQQLERLQREVSDISKSVFSDSNKINNDVDMEAASNLSAIDMRLYDLEKDVKNLNLNLEEIFFQIDDLIKKIDSYENTINQLESKLNGIQNLVQDSSSKNILNESSNDQKNKNMSSTEENSLGELKITKLNEQSNTSIEKNDDKDNSNQEEISVEDQFQLAFDNIRNKKWNEAKSSLSQFIIENPENQLSGSAHYWLGELHILEKEYRDAALIFAEGYQRFPNSVKAPDMLYKLSLSLFEVNKNKEGCNTIQKFIEDYPKNKLIDKSKKIILDNSCSVINE